MRKWFNPEYMGPKIKSLIMERQYIVSIEERCSLFRDCFYMAYENLAYELEIDCIPLEYNAASQSFGFLKKFLKHEKDAEIEKWQEMFLDHYADMYELTPQDRDEEGKYASDKNDADRLSLDDTDEGEFDDEELPDIECRLRNNIYAQCAVNRLVWEISEDWDDYGWIENRKSQFLIELGAHCDKYLLPRLPVSFDPVVHLIAPAEEVEKFFNLAKARENEIEDLKIEEMKNYQIAKENIDSGLSKYDKALERIKLYESHEKNIEDLEYICFKNWKEQNKGISFPSDLGKYTVEMANGIKDNKETITDLEPGSSKTFAKYKPDQPTLQPKKDDPRWN